MTCFVAVILRHHAARRPRQILRNKYMLSAKWNKPGSTCNSKAFVLQRQRQGHCTGSAPLRRPCSYAECCVRNPSAACTGVTKDKHVRRARGLHHERASCNSYMPSKNTSAPITRLVKPAQVISCCCRLLCSGSIASSSSSSSSSSSTAAAAAAAAVPHPAKKAPDCPLEWRTRSSQPAAPPSPLCTPHLQQ